MLGNVFRTFDSLMYELTDFKYASDKNVSPTN